MSKFEIIFMKILLVGTALSAILLVIEKEFLAGIWAVAAFNFMFLFLSQSKKNRKE